MIRNGVLLGLSLILVVPAAAREWAVEVRGDTAPGALVDEMIALARRGFPAYIKIDPQWWESKVPVAHLRVGLFHSRRRASAARDSYAIAGTRLIEDTRTRSPYSEWARAIPGETRILVRIQVAPGHYNHILWLREDTGLIVLHARSRDYHSDQPPGPTIISLPGRFPTIIPNTEDPILLLGARRIFFSLGRDPLGDHTDWAWAFDRPEDEPRLYAEWIQELEREFRMSRSELESLSMIHGERGGEFDNVIFQPAVYDIEMDTWGVLPTLGYLNDVSVGERWIRLYRVPAFARGYRGDTRPRHVSVDPSDTIPPPRDIPWARAVSPTWEHEYGDNPDRRVLFRVRDGRRLLYDSQVFMTYLEVAVP